MSMMWMRMPGQSWLDATTSFLAMWIVMMVPMMLPSLILELRRHRAPVALVGAGYFFVWTVIGLAIFPVGVALAAIERQQPAMARAWPVASGAIVAIAGLLQLTSWKSRQLARYHDAAARTRPAGFGAAWRYGVRLGFDCARCCGNWMAMLLVVGMTDLRAMAIVTAAMTLERVAPGERAALRSRALRFVSSIRPLRSRGTGS